MIRTQKYRPSIALRIFQNNSKFTRYLPVLDHLSMKNESQRTHLYLQTFDINYQVSLRSASKISNHHWFTVKRGTKAVLLVSHQQTQ
jgi:hypothetical protein